MNIKPREDYEIEDFLTDESFTNYHFQSNLEDQLSWDDWLRNHKEKTGIVNQAREFMQTLSLSISNKEFSREFEKIKAAIGTKPREPVATVSNRINTNFKPAIYFATRRNMIYIVPILLILILFAYLLLPVFRGGSEELTQTVNKTNTPLLVKLSDSTIVTLEAHSSLQYPLHFENDKRVVYLQGEARFHVKGNLQAPFKVYAENVVITVLGTIFNLKKSADTAMVVELLKGKLNVEILDDKNIPIQSILLNPDEKAIYVFRDSHFYKKVMEREIHLSFYQSNFDEIAGRVKNAFGITLVNKSDKKQWRFTGNFKNTNASEVIENICLVKKLSYETKGDTIYIK